MYKKDQFKKLASGVTLMASAPTLASFALPGGSSSTDSYNGLNIPSEYSGIDWFKVLKVLGYSILAVVGIGVVIYLAATLLWKEENEGEKGGKNGNEDNVQEGKKAELTVEGLVKKVWNKYGELKKQQKDTGEKYLEIQKECNRIKEEYNKLKEKEDEFTQEREEKIKRERGVIALIESGIYREKSGYLNKANEMLAKAEKCKKYLELKKTSSLAESEIQKCEKAYESENQKRSGDCKCELGILKRKYGQGNIRRRVEGGVKDLSKPLSEKEKKEYEKAKEDINKKYLKLEDKAKEEYENKLSELKIKFNNAKTEFENFEKDNFKEPTFKETLNKIKNFKDTGFLAVSDWLLFNGMKSDGAKEFFEVSKAIKGSSNENDESRIIEGVGCACEKFLESYKKAKKEDLVKEKEEQIENLKKRKSKEEEELGKKLEALELDYSEKSKQFLDLKQQLFQDLPVSVAELKGALESDFRFRSYINKTYGKDSKEGKLVNKPIDNEFDQAKIGLKVNFDN